MIVETLNEYLETLSGYVFDNDKLVTYKWLSKELKIHVNIAKQILWKFWQEHQKDANIECTFLLMGTLNEGGMRLEVVKESNLLATKQKFNAIISEHLYSVQKILQNVELLAISGKGDVDYSAIKCDGSIKRNDCEMHGLRRGLISDEVQKTSEENKKLQIQSTKDQESCTVMHLKSDEHKSVATKKSTTSPKQGFNNLFKGIKNKQKNLISSNSSNTEKSKHSTKNDINQKTSPKDSKPLSKKTNKGMLDMFCEKRSQEKSFPSASSDIKNEKMPANKKRYEIDEHKDKVNEPKKSQDNMKQNKNTNTKKRNRSTDIHDTSKKRKRIMVQDDSTDTESHSEEEIELPPSPENISDKKQSPPPPPIKNEGGKRKLLKIVDKMFEEDGYLVTKKVHVYESCSEDEADNVQMKEPPTPQIQPASNSKKKTKQTTLTNFFKKS